MIAMRVLSREAERIDLDARIEVDRCERRCGEPISTQEAAHVYQTAIGAFTHEARIAELKPIMDSLVRVGSLYLEPPPIPAEIQGFITAINGKWAAVYAELAER